MHILKIFLAGWLVLLAAILINAAAGALGLVTWYDFLKAAGQSGLGPAFRGMPAVHLLFLFVIYPGLLGALAYLAVRLFFRPF